MLVKSVTEELYDSLVRFSIILVNQKKDLVGWLEEMLFNG
jgi:hypothetical protein